MTKAERMEDIKNRYSLALSERNFTEPGTENYRTLSEIAKLILSEISGICLNRCSAVNRYGFRMYGRQYKMIILSDNMTI